MIPGIWSLSTCWDEKKKLSKYKIDIAIAWVPKNYVTSLLTASKYHIAHLSKKLTPHRKITLSNLIAVIQQVLLCSSSAQSCFRSLLPPDLLG